ncbi:TlpA disulfide reductase family protein [Geotalea sp. SG265]|uniref:TlpA disulfide reductase family protein n=1 Tax=Geotalea sp. SG265 TaxID=2922867 RepID=UPI001FAED612|nr:TlpA disulfide reductase family protein [Geotalea sp. SG265]
MKKVFFATLILCALLAACTRGSEPAIEGKAAPDFTLQDLSGRQVQLSQFKGKVVFLNFWATWCPPCREEIPSMMKLNRDMAGKPFQMLAVSIDEGGKGAVENFFGKSGMMLPALLDTDNAVSKRYGTTGVPETFVLDKNGMIVKKVVGGMDWSDPQVVAYFNELAAR